MAKKPFLMPIEDSVAKVNGEVAVGEDLEFQRKWWRFENAVWIVFAVILLLDLSGLFGRGPLAKAERRSADGTIDVAYERIERTDSPSIMSIRFAQPAIRNGKIEMYISDSLVRELGTQRVIPAPETSTVGAGGITYTFPATTVPAIVDMALQPAHPGIYAFTVQVPGLRAVRAKIAVVP